MTALPKPLPKTGSVVKQWGSHRHRSKNEVALRVRRTGGYCEAPDCFEPATDWAHLFARGHLVAEPWASLPELTRGLCREHHNAMDRRLDEFLLARLRWGSFDSLAERFSDDAEATKKWARSLWPEALDAVRHYVQLLEEQGWSWDPSTQSLRMEP